MVDVLCKQLCHKYVGDSQAIQVMSTMAVIVVMNLKIGSLLCLTQITLKNSDICGFLGEQQEKRSAELDWLSSKFTTKASNYVVIIM